jgi:hypothetical protein
VDGLEHIELGGEVLGTKLKVKAAVTSGSALNLALAGCLCAITLFVIGVHGWWAASGFLFPAVYPLCVRRARPSDGGPDRCSGRGSSTGLNGE